MANKDYKKLFEMACQEICAYDECSCTLGEHSFCSLKDYENCKDHPVSLRPEKKPKCWQKYFKEMLNKGDQNE